MEICAKLDGLPLAIELAAARTRIVSLPEMLEHLDHRLGFLVSKQQDVPDRYRSLWATIEWSYRLLSNEPFEYNLAYAIG